MLDNLASIIRKLPIEAKAFYPQLQRSFVKYLDVDDQPLSQCSAIRALAVLVPLVQKPEPVLALFTFFKKLDRDSLLLIELVDCFHCILVKNTVDSVKPLFLELFVQLAQYNNKSFLAYCYSFAFLLPLCDDEKQKSWIKYFIVDF